MAIVRKRHYEKSNEGIRLQQSSRQYKNAMLQKAIRTAITDAAFHEELVLSVPRFKGGNDAVLEYLKCIDPDRNKKIKRTISRHHANSAVNDTASPFAKIGGQRTRYTLIPEEPSFKHFHTNRNREINNGTPRGNDTEYKLLERVSEDITDDVEEGLIKMYTYYEPCLSCDYVIIQFTKRYPNIDIEIYYEEEYKPEEKGLI